MDGRHACSKRLAARAALRCTCSHSRPARHTLIQHRSSRLPRAGRGPTWTHSLLSCIADSANILYALEVFVLFGFDW
jgi:hypothetical protein